MNFMYIVGCIVFTVSGQLLVKQGVVSLNNKNSLILYFTNLYILGGFAFAFLAAFSWIKALQHFDLSYAYPFMSLSFLFVILLSSFLFDESVHINQWIGLVIILAGLYIGSR